MILPCAATLPTSGRSPSSTRPFPVHPVAAAERAEPRVAFERGGDALHPVGMRRGVVVGDRDHVAARGA